MFDKETTVAVLDGQENLLGFLNPKHIQIKEGNDSSQLRTITLTCQLVDETNDDLSFYDEMLNNGNKLYRTQNTDGKTVLYVIEGPKIYGEKFTDVTITATEAAVELGEIKILRNSAFEWDVDDDIASIVSELFDKGVIDGPTDSTAYTGALTPLAIINEIQNRTGGEFDYRYEYDPETDVIKRYIDFHEQIGETHSNILEMGRNAEIISLSVDDTDVGVAAGPTGEPSSSDDEFHKRMKAFEDLDIAKGASIPLYYTKNDNGNEVAGPNAYAPYAKVSGKNYVECDESSELVASYQRINGKEKSAITYPRIKTFTTSETNAVNIYWECVSTIREHLQPEVDLSIDLVNLVKLEGADDYYNVGDVIKICLPTRSDIITCRITKTEKNPREPHNETVEISTYNATFMQDFFKRYFRSTGAIHLS